ncbi:lysozyme inhibitor LprI family protein [Candidatus Igneacidithiobacillus taiwanensis]|uniref:lysozyme inhibitor LprI family protein n=1 Tax=Candidatus Igneacidithiobacillus taiwanensis TaxID=1945924 RepID=UPI0028A0A1DB|nr:lysozyme inhibitor LprI family protein [Candidatus Igneacidithiobacillus taiwanensis]
MQFWPRFLGSVVAAMIIASLIGPASTAAPLPKPVLSTTCFSQGPFEGRDYLSDCADPEESAAVKKYLASYGKGLPVRAKKPFSLLRQTITKLADDGVLYCYDGHSVSSNGYFYRQAEYTYWQQFIDLLEQVSAGSLRSHTSFSKADQKLNNVYKNIHERLSNLPAEIYRSSEMGYCSDADFSNVQKSQRLWLTYRDAWKAFAAQVAPEQQESILAQLTLQRSNFLEDYLQDVQNSLSQLIDSELPQGQPCGANALALWTCDLRAQRVLLCLTRQADGKSQLDIRKVIQHGKKQQLFYSNQADAKIDFQRYPNGAASLIVGSKDTQITLIDPERGASLYEITRQGQTERHTCKNPNQSLSSNVVAAILEDFAHAQSTQTRTK